ncbi:MAG: helix-turn-helix transcriptional regulator [Flavobacteriales bacterium]
MTFLSTNLRILRRYKGLTVSQQMVADAIGVKRSAYNGWESGPHEPSADNLVKLAVYHQTSLDRMLRDDLAKLGEFDLGVVLRQDRVLLKNLITTPTI